MHNKARFEREFGFTEPSMAQQDDEETIDNAKTRRRKKRAPAKRPPDYEEMFKGNVEEEFKMGIALSKKVSCCVSIRSTTHSLWSLTSMLLFFLQTSLLSCTRLSTNRTS